MIRTKGRNGPIRPNGEPPESGGGEQDDIKKRIKVPIVNFDLIRFIFVPL